MYISLLNDPSMGHTMVLSLHLLKLLKSSRRFIDLMTTVKYDSISCIKCLQPIHSQLKVWWNGYAIGYNHMISVVSIRDEATPPSLPPARGRGGTEHALQTGILSHVGDSQRFQEG